MLNEYVINGVYAINGYMKRKAYNVRRKGKYLLSVFLNTIYRIRAHIIIEKILYVRYMAFDEYIEIRDNMVLPKKYEDE